MEQAQLGHLARVFFEAISTQTLVWGILTSSKSSFG
uniref:Uncharacterized protein n=1 Tax=Nymphaea colorata TaxID=210225 RepID=A0A5K1DHF7_9MAGN